MGTERQRRWIVALAAVVTVVVTARLGMWQLDRAAQKTALHTALTARTALPPLDTADLGLTPEAAALQHHRRVTLRGRWRHDLTVYLDNRQMNERPGFFVVTPLLLPSGAAVAVQRGWVPRDLRDRQRLPAVPTPDGDVELAGRIAPGPARLYDFGDEAPGLIRQNLDLVAWARETGLRLLPLSVVQTESAAVAGDGLGRDWLPAEPDVHKHYGYAFQWFGLSTLCAGLYVWFQLILPRRRRT